jgi:uncharacterized protein (DUF924 family)
MSDHDKINEILEFWFGEIGADGNVVEDRSALWWKKNPEADALIRRRFEELVQQAGRGELDWAGTPRGCLALIIALDQLPRNIYRDTARAFAFDGKALELALGGLASGADCELPPIQRVFFYMPLEHAESRELQRRSVELFTELAGTSPAFEVYLDFARQHQAIIERFGRFPHRNAILGRQSTREELAFLEQPGSSF